MASIPRRPQTAATTDRMSLVRPATSVLLTRASDDVSILTKGTSSASRAAGTAFRGKSRGVAAHIRQKEEAILDEIQRLQTETATMERDKARNPSLQSKRDALRKSVLQLEGELTDHNIANDRALNLRVLPSDLEDANATLQANNKKLAAEVNAAIIDTNEQEHNLKVLVEQVQSKYADIEKKVKEEGDQEQLKRVRSLRTLMGKIQGEKKRREEEISAINQNVVEIEDSAMGQRIKEYEALLAKASQLEVNLSCLQEEAEALEMPTSDAREALMTATENKERSIATCDQELEQLDLGIKNLLTLRDNLISELTSVELEKLGDEGSLPGDDLPIYYQEIGQKKDIFVAKDDLAALEERRMQLEEELVQYDDLVGLQARSDQARDALKKKKKELTERIAETKPAVTELSLKCEANKAKLDSDSNYSSLEQMQEKQAAQEREIGSLEEFIEVKGRECEYKRTKSKCLELVRSLNEGLIRTLQ